MLWALPGFFGLREDWAFLNELGKVDENLRLAPLRELWSKDLCRLSLSDFGRALNEEVRRSKDTKPFLVGYSLGARLGLHALLGDDTAFRGALLISCHFGLRNSEEKKIRFEKDELWAQKILSKTWAALEEEWNAQEVFKEDPRRPRSEEAYSREALAAGMRNWSLGRQDYLEGRLHELGGLQMKLIVGENDPRFVFEALAAARQIKGARLCIAPKSGHRLLWQAPELIKSELVALAKSL